MAIKHSVSWPPPVYVARFSDGTECRMSVSSYSKKLGAYDFERGRKIACDAIGAERVERAHRERHPNRVHLDWGSYVKAVWHPDDMRRLYAAAGPATDLIGGHFEHDGAIIPDPHFAPAEAPVKRKPGALDRLIASLGKLTADELIALSEAVDHAFAAAE